MNKQMLKLINEELTNLQQEMKELDRQYIEKQKRVRELKKAKEELEKNVISSKPPDLPSVEGYSGWNNPKNFSRGFNKKPLTGGFVYCD